jgi:hypothetical protein
MAFRNRNFQSASLKLNSSLQVLVGNPRFLLPGYAPRRRRHHGLSCCYSRYRRPCRPPKPCRWRKSGRSRHNVPSCAVETGAVFPSQINPVSLSTLSWLQLRSVAARSAILQCTPPLHTILLTASGERRC